jgi:hypothetical protein
MGAADDFFKWNSEVRRLAAKRECALTPQERRRLDRRIEAAENRAFSALRAIAGAVRERRDAAGEFWDALADHVIDSES